jgi:hypothetical protein
MDIPVGAQVRCVDGVCGRSSRVILNPITDRVTHVVVKSKALPHTEHLVSLGQVLETTPHLIRLRCTQDELAKMEAFVETEYIPMRVPGKGYEAPTPYAYPGAAYLLSPYAVPEETQYIPVEHQHIPPNEMAIRRGAPVHATDGAIGRVDEFLVNPANGYISHLVLREGHPWGQKDVTIPVAEIDRFEEGTVYLKLDKHSVEALPTIPIRRNRV